MSLFTAKEWTGLALYAALGHFCFQYATCLFIETIRLPGNDFEWAAAWESTQNQYRKYWNYLVEGE